MVTHHSSVLLANDLGMVKWTPLAFTVTRSLGVSCLNAGPLYAFKIHESFYCLLVNHWWWSLIILVSLPSLDKLFLLAHVGLPMYDSMRVGMGLAIRMGMGVVWVMVHITRLLSLLVYHHFLWLLCYSEWIFHRDQRDLFVPFVLMHVIVSCEKQCPSHG